ncbi:MAG: T9SS type A sorting domain-containing protein [Bacteroidetes bacterium]|nr:T9SS type A sorting domain-containing protein [Bacteroidota bacterium]
MKRLRKKIHELWSQPQILNFFFTLFFLPAYSICIAQISSVSNGYWSNASTWNGGIVPSSTDSITINHFVIYNNNLLIESGGSVTINNGGTLCGQGTFQVMCGGYFYNYGTINGNVIKLTDGFNNGWVHALTIYNVAPCLASFPLGGFSVGVPFTCNFTGENEASLINPIHVFPNPIFDHLNISATSNETLEIILYDINLTELMQETFINSISLNTSQLNNGIYIYKLRNKNGTFKEGKVIKQ